jgi:hypothetical protein
LASRCAALRNGDLVMKKGKPLKRGGPLKRTSSLKSTGFLKRGSALSKGSKLSSGQPRRLSREERQEAFTWFTNARWEDPDHTKPRWCAVGGEGCGQDLQVHHIVPKRILKQESLQESIWDDRNALVLCKRCHERHELAVMRVRKDLLPPASIVFADEVGLSWVIDRFYD